MARYFKEKDIDEFRECFYLFARSGSIKSADELAVIMRSLGLSPTTSEITSYLKKKWERSLQSQDARYFWKVTLVLGYIKWPEYSTQFVQGGKMTFADFLEVMHIHSRLERVPQEVIEAFKANDSDGKGVIPAKNLRHLLQNWGECLPQKEVDRIFREANVNNNSMVRYEDFVKIACAPVPDYY